MVWTVPTNGCAPQHSDTGRPGMNAGACGDRSTSIGAAMTDPPSNGVALRRLTLAATVVITGAVIGAAAIYERTRVRWWRQVHPLATPRASLERTLLDLQGKRGNLRMALAAAASMAETVRIVRQTSNYPN